MKIVADDAIPYVEQAFGHLGELTLLPGRSIGPEHVRDATVLVTRSVTRVDERLVAHSGLKLVVSATAGIDHVDLDALAGHGARFEHAPGCNAIAVVEYVLTAMALVGSARSGPPSLDPLERLGQRPVGVVGFGQVGRRLAARLRALGFEVLVHDPPLREALAHDRDPDGPPAWRAMARAEDFMPLGDVLERCGVVTLHVPLTDRGPHLTRHLVNASCLRQLPEQALLINTCRGAVVDNDALESWLESGRGEAVIDVWEGEPNLRWSMFDHAGLRVATPHIAGYTLEGKVRATRMAAAHVREFVGARDVGWTGDGVLGRPGSAVLEGPDVRAAMLEVHPIEEDDRALRGVWHRGGARADGFEGLRRGYRLRREFDHFRVGEGVAEEVEGLLRRLGVHPATCPAVF